MLVTPSGLEPGLDGATVVMPDTYWGDLTRPRLVDGRYPVEADEIAVTEQLAIEHHHEVGEVIDLRMLMPESHGGACIRRRRLHDDERWPCDDHRGAPDVGGSFAPGPYSDGLFVAPEAFLADRGGDRRALGDMHRCVPRRGSERCDAVVRDYSVKVANGNVSDGESGDVVGVMQATDLQRNTLLIASAVAAAAGLLIAGQAFGRFLARRSSDRRR